VKDRRVIKRKLEQPASGYATNYAGALPLRSTIAPNDRETAIARRPARNALRRATDGKARSRGADTLGAV
jgi:hypothetical protein